MSVKIIIDKMIIDNPATDNIVEAQGKTVGECLRDLVKQRPLLKKALFDDKGQLLYDKLFIVNGKYELAGVIAKTVKERDQITILKFREG